MIDVHVHASFFSWEEIPNDTVNSSDAMRTLAVAECARKTLEKRFHYNPSCWLVFRRRINERKKSY